MGKYLTLSLSLITALSAQFVVNGGTDTTKASAMLKLAQTRTLNGCKTQSSLMSLSAHFNKYFCSLLCAS